MICPDCSARLELETHRPECGEPLKVSRSATDAPELYQALVGLERANAGAAEWLLVRGIHPHSYRAGDGARRSAA